MDSAQDVSPAPGLHVDAQNMAALFREFKVTSCQVAANGDVYWYFPANLILWFDGAEFWLRLAQRSPYGEVDDDA